ncbi:sister chromatid cohesion protein PDS5 homolog D-like [Syzygium oleosum]|uniref:sister chromatid cohesion protein PDS5 homolog D-like n=1 Tax=Syzygium oleosum TaxID=219896 RepID=UPI0024BBE66A|nr:sister chromatid cohesion protein PDS5 homolog D-like [Syzygium oleosum]
MEQEPSDFLLDALLPVMKGLIAEALFKHCNEDVRVTLASCLSEILRITSPEQPFNDDQMKAIFQLIVEAISKLSRPLTQCYEKALSILETVARVKACLLMLDLECEALVLHMCQHLWVFTRSNPSADEYWAVEQIMADILAESEDISPDLLIPLLASVLKENERVAPFCWKLGEKLISDYAEKLRPILRGVLQSKGTTLDDYSPVVALLYQNESTTEHNDTSGSPKQGSADYLDSKGAMLHGKRELKPNSSMRPEEDYDVSWLYREGQTTEQPHKRRISVSRIELKSNVETVRGEAALLPIDLREKKMKLPTKGGNNTSKGTSRESGVLADGLVGRRIKVWWPLDEMFCDGRIQSYDPITKKHKVLYDDGDRETLNLEKEWWEFIEDDLPDEHRQVADNPKRITLPIILRKQNGHDESFQSTMILNYKKYVTRAGAVTRLLVEEAPNLGHQNIGGDESSDDESTEDNVFEFRARSKDVQLENPSVSTSDDSTPEASPPRAIKVGSKDLQLENGRSTSNDSTPEASPLRSIRAKPKDVRLQSTSNDSTPEATLPRYIRAKSKDVRLHSTSDDSTPEGSPPRPWGLWRSRRH